MIVHDLLATHGAVCGERLIRATHSRADVEWHELERHGLVPREARCALCAQVAPVYGID